MTRRSITSLRVSPDASYTSSGGWTACRWGLLHWCCPARWVLQQNAPAPSLGGLTGLERRISALWQGTLREVPGNGKAHSCKPGPVGTVAAGPGFRLRVSLRLGVTRQGFAAGSGRPGRRCVRWDVVVAVDQDQRKRRRAGLQSLRGQFYSGWAVRRNGRHCSVQSSPFPKLNRAVFGAWEGAFRQRYFFPAPCQCVAGIVLQFGASRA